MRNAHLHYVHSLWAQWIQDIHYAVDATCGHGHDSLALMRCAQQAKQTVHLTCVDIQKTALESTQHRLKTHLCDQAQAHIRFAHQNHATFTFSHPIDLFIYNLGYLPRTDKQQTTLATTTLESLRHALNALSPQGKITLVLYTGHPEGMIESQQVLDWSAKLCPQRYLVSHQSWINRPQHPFVITICAVDFFRNML